MLFQRVWKVMFLACVWRILIQLFVCFSFLDSQTFPSSPPTQLIGAYYLFLAVLIFNIVDNFWARLIDFHNCEQWLLAVVQCSSSSSSSSTSSSGAHYGEIHILKMMWMSAFIKKHSNLLCGLQKLTIIAFFSLKQYL